MTSPAHTEDEFRRLVEPHRAELHAHCYRMLGSVHDAEDALQEALLRAWRGLGRFEGRSSLRSWLYRIATNACAGRDRAAAEARAAGRPRPAVRPARRPASRSSSRSGSSPTRTALGVADGHAAPDARYERRESVELAFIAALQHLPATPARGADPARRARLLGARGRRDARHDGRRRSTARCSAPARRSRSGCPTGASRRRCARWATTPSARSSSATSTPSTAATSRRSWRCSPRTRAGRCRRCPPGTRASTRSRRSSRPARCRLRWRHRPTHANGQPAVGCYLWDEARGDHHGWVIDVLTLDGPRIAAVTSFIGHEAFARFGLPDALP